MFEIYGRKNCSWCDAAKALLERKGLGFFYYDIELDLERREEFKTRFPEARSVPQIVNVTGDYIGGYEALEKYIEVHF